MKLNCSGDTHSGIETITTNQGTFCEDCIDYIITPTQPSRTKPSAITKLMDKCRRVTYAPISSSANECEVQTMHPATNKEESKSKETNTTETEDIQESDEKDDEKDGNDIKIQMTGSLGTNNNNKNRLGRNRNNNDRSLTNTNIKQIKYEDPDVDNNKNEVIEEKEVECKYNDSWGKFDDVMEKNVPKQSKQNLDLIGDSFTTEPETDANDAQKKHQKRKRKQKRGYQDLIQGASCTSSSFWFHNNNIGKDINKQITEARKITGL